MSPICKEKRDLCRASDLNREEIIEVLRRATELKTALREGRAMPLLAGRTLAMIFEKPSLRTRCTFQIGMFQLGGHSVYLQQHEIGIGTRESVHDIACNLERWFDIVMARTFSQATVDELAQHCRLPVINALSDDEHPCQALADLLTLTEHVGKLDGFRLTYIGDGNNICHSLMIMGVQMGMHVTVSSPEGYAPSPEVTQQALAIGAATGGRYTFEPDPKQAVQQAQAIYTDVWASMGQEAEAESRKQVFLPYQVNEALVAAAPSDVLIMHDLPAHRGEEITAGVMDHPNTVIFDQAENRLHAQKGLMVFLSELSR